jgi:heme exporter protein D
MGSISPHPVTANRWLAAGSRAAVGRYSWNKASGMGQYSPFSWVRRYWSLCRRAAHGVKARTAILAGREPNADGMRLETVG